MGPLVGLTRAAYRKAGCSGSLASALIPVVEGRVALEAIVGLLSAYVPEAQEQPAPIDEKHTEDQSVFLAVTKPDRLARSTAELLTIEADLTKRGIGLIVLSMGGERLDTRNPTSKPMLTILAGVAAWEREIMLERQREGIAKAKGEGKCKSRPASIDATQIRNLAATMGPAAIAKHLGIARSSVYRLLEAAT
jgi:DNA invertase Pin-like site-specific DNA recombinase